MTRRSIGMHAALRTAVALLGVTAFARAAALGVVGRAFAADQTPGIERSPAPQSSVARAAAAPSPLPSGVPPSGSHLFEATSRHSFEDVEYWKSIFEDPARDAWQKPREVVAALGLRPGMSVADLGAGTGYFTHHLAPAVGPSGTVFAVETEPNLVSYLRARAEREGATNVTPVLASFDNPHLPAGAIDLVLIVDTFHHIDQRLSYFQQLKEVLRPGGRVAVIDWRIDKLPVGPPPEHKIAREQVVTEMEAAGYRLADEQTKLLPYHYFLIFQPT